MTTDTKLRAIVDEHGITYSSMLKYEQGFIDEVIDALVSHSLSPEMERAAQDVFGWEITRDRRLLNAINRLAAALEAK